ncbi:MAG: class I SAM-dependent methyltransferase, partial [Candidatus Moranbacteria bacterium]|nr:class I SAM-dependent methyltransferase [Candidatus Moranbacteria bacterium]
MKTTTHTQYDTLSQEYTRLVLTDPAKQFVQYPSALDLLGDVFQKTILDVGCGSGIFDRELAHRGAIITGYDISSEQIAMAQEAEQARTLGITYLVSTPQEFQPDKKFNLAVSVLVLHYALDIKNLTQFFLSTHQALKDDGKFVCILDNPGFKRLGEVLYNRRFTKLPSGKMLVEFFDANQAVSLSAEYSDFSMSDYEQAATNGGFKKFSWINLEVAEIGLRQMGQDYW